MKGTLYWKKHRPSDETLNRGPDSLWSLKIPGCPSIKSRGVTPASWPNSPIGLWPSWPPNHPHTLIGFITVSSPPVSWCVVGVLAHYGCRRIIQVDAAHWWWMRRFPPLLCKVLWVSRKALYKCNKLLLIIPLSAVVQGAETDLTESKTAHLLSDGPPVDLLIHNLHQYSKSC